jgi:hypothetical protein
MMRARVKRTEAVKKYIEEHIANLHSKIAQLQEQLELAQKNDKVDDELVADLSEVNELQNEEM